ncbi:MAG: GIY-YIG nuclease family protein [Chitinophagales bacterium]|nr:GIY-YIG nuclease family protein [Chitinophagales bacterium]
MFAIVDVETTGGSPSFDRITEVAVLVHNGKRIIESFSSLINPQQEIDPFVMALTGISNEMVEDAPLFEDVYPVFEELTRDKILVAHNVRFDYGMIRREYKRMDRRFQRKHLCTVKLARKIFPGLRSYSLGTLCKNLEIPIMNRHRAYGDAEATTVLFEKLLFNDRKELIYSELENELSEQLLPPNLSKHVIDDLPEDTGVYYFLNQQNKILYIGKSLNIRQRIISHFSNDLKKARYAELKKNIYSVNYELAGNDLIAQLIESAEIKKYMPPFNRALRRKKYRYGIYVKEDQLGLKKFEIGPMRLEEKPLILCTTKRSAELTHERLEKKHQLKIFKQLMSLSYKNEERSIKVRKIYEERMKRAIEDQEYPHENFFIVGEGLRSSERSIVCIEQSEYKGFGYIDNGIQTNRPDELKEFIQFGFDTPDVKRIIKRWIKKNRSTSIIKY